MAAWIIHFHSAKASNVDGELSDHLGLVSTTGQISTVEVQLLNIMCTFDSSVGRAEDCSCCEVILRSLVRIRLEGSFFD